jgi:hypothetical protein
VNKKDVSDVAKQKATKLLLLIAFVFVLVATHLLDVCCDVLLNAVLGQCSGGDINSLLLHLLAHVSILHHRAAHLAHGEQKRKGRGERDRKPDKKKKERRRKERGAERATDKTRDTAQTLSVQKWQKEIPSNGGGASERRGLRRRFHRPLWPHKPAPFIAPDSVARPRRCLARVACILTVSP